ncbi:MAG: hypothetical protein GY830_09505 [Bacteroidetes bacterium]|nr:hypothetical protein [Bacteroidota bacterium]
MRILKITTIIYSVLLLTIGCSRNDKSLRMQKSTWDCNACTFINNFKSKNCKICSTERTFSKIKNQFLGIYQKLLNMGFDETISLEVSQKFPNNINKAITHINQLEKNSEIQENDQKQSTELLLYDEKEMVHNKYKNYSNNSNKVAISLSTSKLPCQFTNIIFYFPGMTREDADDSKYIRKSLKSSFFIDNNKIKYGCGVSLILEERIIYFFADFIKYLKKYNNLPINCIGHSQGGPLGSVR